MATEPIVPEKLLQVLACPACEDRPRVRPRENALECPKCGAIYPVQNGIPAMVIGADGAREVEGSSEGSSDPRPQS